MFLIAEIGQAHEGSLGLALSYVEAVAAAGVDAIKFQVHIAEAESSIHEPFRVKFSDQDASRYDYWKRMEFSLEQWKLLKNKCDQLGIEFLASPFSNAAVDLLEQLQVKRYKIGSGEVNNFLLLNKIAQTNKPIILSSGMSSYAELDRSVEFLKQHDCDFSILQCTTSYPTSPKNYGLNVIGELKDRYQVKVGFSDHSAQKSTLIAAAAVGAEILEFHVVFDRKMFGPDAQSSIEINELPELVTALKNIAVALKNPVDKNEVSQYRELKGIFEKSLTVNKDLKKGSILKLEDLESKKPKNYGINADKFEKIIGKKINRDLKKWDFINYNDLEEITT